MPSKLKCEPIESSPFRKAPEACAYLQIGRNALDSLADASNAKVKLSPRCVVYDVPKIEEYIRNQSKVPKVTKSIPDSQKVSADIDKQKDLTVVEIKRLMLELNRQIDKLLDVTENKANE